MKDTSVPVGVSKSQSHRYHACPPAARRALSAATILALLLALAGAALLPTAAYAAGTINVTTTTDENGTGAACSLREALTSANNDSNFGGCTGAGAGGPFTINVPAGTYNLSVDELQVGTNSGADITISGAGSSSTTIHQTDTNFRVFDLDPSVVGDVAVTITGVTISGGYAQAFGGGAILGGGTNDTLILSNSVLTDNHCSGFFSGAGISWSPDGNLTISNTTFSNNTCASGAAGGILYTTGNGSSLTVTNSTFSGNTAGATGSAGGAIFVGGNGGSPTFNINGNTFLNNQATNASGIGGAIYVGGGTLNLGTTQVNRFVGNTAGISSSGGLGVRGGTANATKNWWACNGGPGSGSGCDKADNSGGTLNFTPWVVLTHTASPNPIMVNQTTTLTADFLHDSAGGSLPLSQIGVLLGLPISFGGAVRGTVSGAQASIQANGTATATFTATAAGAGSANATVDNGTATASITINKANTTTALTSDTPDPSVTGQPVTVSYSVTSSTGSTPTAPTGSVTVSDGVNSCTGTLAAGQCTLALFTAGSRTLTATYSGDSNFNTSSSTPATPHQVDKADTTTTITADNPDPSVVGQPVTIQYNVTVDSPGSGTPTGNVTVSDGTQSCTGTVAAGQCTIAFTSTGVKTLTATYAGDANYNGSTSASVSHQVNKANTATTITSDLPDPSVVGQVVTVQYSVAAVAPGAGTPTGNVTVSDGVDSCTATVAAGQCTVTITTPGSRPLTATYAGDSNFNGSTSASAPHTVNKIATTTTITSDTPDPSVVGQGVTVQFGVAISGPGSGTPTGNVTVSDGTNSCTGTVAAGQCTITFTSVGAKSLTATYAGDSNFNGSTSASVSHQVNKADTTTTITTDNPDPSVVGQAVTVQFSVTVDSPGSGTPTGNVTVSDGTDSCTGTVAAGQCTITFSSAGAKTLTATYAGDSNFNGSTSAGEPHQVNPRGSITTITSDNPDPSVVGQSITVQYTVAPASGGGTPTGIVTVSEGTDSCTGTVAAGQCTIILTGAGARSLTATYAGDSVFGSSTSAVEPHQVDKADTTTTITGDAPDPSMVGEAVTVQFSVTVNSPGSGTPTGNVTVSDGTDSCTGTVAAGQCTITFTSAGAKSLTATYAGDSNFNGSTSASVSHQVNKGLTTTTITSDTPDPSAVGQAITIQFSVTVDSPGSGTPTGNVTVSDGTDSCTGTVAAGQCTITFTSIGNKTLIATYAGDSDFNGGPSAAEPHRVNQNGSTTTITSDSPDPSVVGQAVTVQYSVTPGGSGTPTGSVTVSDGTDSCTGTVAAGQCTITLTTAGARNLTASYSGDSNFGGSISAAEPHQVDKADTTTTITSDTPDPSAVGQPVTVQYSVAVSGLGSGTPTGNVTVSDGTDSCTGTVAAGQCTFTFSSPGAKTLTATYAGDSNFNGSTSAGVPHTVTINHAPTAQPDSYTTNEDTPLSVTKPGVLANDSDTDAGDTLTAVLGSGPSHAAAFTLNADGSFSYTPDPNFNGSDSFTYKAKDNHNAESTAATVTINVTAVNDAPSFTKGSDVTVTAVAGPYSAAWATAISAGPANESGQGLTFLVTGNTNPGLFSAAPAIAANGTLTFTPAPNANGQAAITVVLKDNAGTANGGQDTSAPQTFTITVTSTSQRHLYLPMITRPGAVTAAPDLVVTSISLIPNKSTFKAGEPVEVRVTVTNQGSAVAAPFWVDLYINPSSPPTAANQVWNTRCGMTPCFGMAWEVTSGLAPGQSITLSSLNLPPGYSIWPGYFAAGSSDLYAYADSYKPGVASGAVAESDETNNRGELHGLSVTGPNPSLVGLQGVTDLPSRPPHLRK